jgi:hypothetical protein
MTLFESELHRQLLQMLEIMGDFFKKIVGEGGIQRVLFGPVNTKKAGAGRLLNLVCGCNGTAAPGVVQM